ncbi:hypothetical protein ACQKNB_09555 [Lysinibacillus xylanilyticus]|uniref:hypothetical protein n=1 Tax=Lysinibacillus xylanilyticus TaxID=582475 RepID=UPI003D06A8B0
MRKRKNAIGINILAFITFKILIASLFKTSHRGKVKRQLPLKKPFVDLLIFSTDRYAPLVDGCVRAFILTKRVDSVFLFCLMEIIRSVFAHLELFI